MVELRRIGVHGSARLAITASLVCMAGLWLRALPGDLDTSFGTAGMARVDIRSVLTGSGFSSEDSYAVVVQDDGKLIAVGYTSLPAGNDVAIARFSRDGLLDSSYGTGGVVTTDISGSNDSARAAVLQPDGRLVVVGETYPAGTLFIVRYNDDGSLDSTFAESGKAIVPYTGYGPSVAIQPDGGIVIAGTSSAAGLIVRYNANGSLDTSFLNGTRAGLREARAVVVQPDHRIVVGGWAWAGAGTDECWDLVLERLLPDGSPDGSFGVGGRVTTDIAWTDAPSDMAVQPDGKIVVGLIIRPTVESGLDFALARYTTAGLLDPSFGNDGKVTTDVAGRNDYLRGIALETDGHIVAAGGSENAAHITDLAVARYDGSGQLDSAFGTAGVVLTAVASSSNGGSDVAVQTEGKVVVAGSVGSDFLLARYVTTSVTSDLAITVNSGSPAPDVLAGGTLTYSVGFANNGPDTASRATVKDTVPVSTTYVSSRVVSGSGWQLVSAPAVGARGDVIWSKSGPGPASGETAQFEFVVAVNATTFHGTMISNTATTYSGDPGTLDPAPTNNALATTTRSVAVVDPQEPNDTPATATVLPMGTTPDLIYTGGNTPDVDWYKFFVPPEAAGQDLKVNVRITSPYPDPLPTNWRSDLDFTLFDGSLAIRGLALSGSDNETLYIHAAASGWYYVHLGYCTVGYAGAPEYARYAVTVESGTGFGVGYVSGRLVDSTGQGIEQVYVRLSWVPYDHDVSFPIITSGPGGYFWIAASPGLRTLLFEGNLDDGGPTVNVVEKPYPDQFQILHDYVVDLGDITLEIGAIVSGRVTNTSGTPLYMAVVYAYDGAGISKAYAYTDGNGNYTLSGVPAGARLRFSKGGYAPEFYDDRPSLAAATVCATQPGATLTGINAQLSAGGTVSGTVRNESGVGIRATVRLYSVTDGVSAYASALSSATTGAFTIQNVRPGDYKIFVSAPTGVLGYAPRWYGDSGSFGAATVITVTEGAATAGVSAVLRHRADRDGDGKHDISVYRPAGGTWFSLDSSTGNTTYRYRGWGVEAEGDRPVLGDFDADGILDPAVFRPAAGTWFILKSSSDFADWQWFGWGNSTDTLVPGDYDGDRKTDAAVYRPSSGTWYVRPSNGAPPWNVVFGQAGDEPIAGDFDGDGVRDPAVYRAASGTWFWLKSSTNFTTYDYRGWGVQAQGDRPAPGDYDGDGKTDLCVFRPGVGTWFIVESHGGWTTWNWFGWGTSTDTLVPADFDGDGRTDAAVYRASEGRWYVRPSGGASPWNVVFGQAGDVPLQGVR